MPFPPVPAPLARALAGRGYDEPTPVQLAILQPETAGRDLLVSAQTGSGKTLAYGLAIAPTLLGETEAFEPRQAPLGLVIAPTRELALQVQRELSWLFASTGARIVSCVGGMDIRREQRALDAGSHLVVGTPGRLRDHLERGSLTLSALQAVVLDEADEMLDLGFKEDLERLLEGAPAERRTLLFSATIPRGILSIAKQYQKDALRIALSSADEPHGDIDVRVYPVAPQERNQAVVNLLRFFDAKGALVFCSTREAVRNLHGYLLERGFTAVALSGELHQAERTRALQTLRDGHARVCVATDVAARGLDVPDLGLVIHADLPQDPQLLVHRSGRTARAGKKGIAALIVPYPACRYAERLLAAGNTPAHWAPPPQPDEIRALDQQRLVQELALLAEEPGEEDLAAAQLLLTQRSPEQLVAALVRLQRGQLPAPEEITPPPPRDAGRPTRPRSGPNQHERSVWFRIEVGRSNNADPRWLVPYLCRRGHVFKNEIGAIRIGAHQTQFEIAPAAAARFAAASRRPDPEERELRIEPEQGDGARRPNPGGSGPPRRR